MLVVFPQIAWAIGDELAVTSGKMGLSVIVSDANAGARNLYERCGYRETARRPTV
jgi:ribosomal protein S18 acetylase RimI-like enzyme